MKESHNSFRVFIDTNLLISSTLSHDSISHRLMELLMKEHHLMIRSYSITETFKVINKRFPEKRAAWDHYLSKLKFELIYTPDHPTSFRSPHIRDEKDIPILVSAILAKPDILITGDMDFHTKEIKSHFAIYTPGHFFQIFK